jgi:hypothetical protein
LSGLRDRRRPVSLGSPDLSHFNASH